MTAAVPGSPPSCLYHSGLRRSVPTAPNATWFAQEGGALVVEQPALGGLGTLVRGLLADDARLGRLRAGVRQIDRPGSLDLILDDLETLNQPPPAPEAIQFTLA